MLTINYRGVLAYRTRTNYKYALRVLKELIKMDQADERSR